MKKLLWITLLCLAFNSFAQVPVVPRDSSTNQVAYIEVVPVENISASELYSRAREWASTTFKSANDVLQMQDKEAGKLIGKAYSDFYTNYGILVTKTQMWYTFKVYVKDNKYRYEITDIMFKDYPSKEAPKTYEIPAERWFDERAYNKKGEFKNLHGKYFEKMDAGMKTLIASLKDSMNKKGATAAKDW